MRVYRNDSLVVDIVPPSPVVEGAAGDGALCRDYYLSYVAYTQAIRDCVGDRQFGVFLGYGGSPDGVGQALRVDSETFSDVGTGAKAVAQLHGSDSSAMGSGFRGVGIVDNGVDEGLRGDGVEYGFRGSVCAATVSECVDGIQSRSGDSGFCGVADDSRVRVSQDVDVNSGASSVVVSERTLRNREKRQKQRRAKERKRNAKFGDVSSVVDGTDIPVWRRKSVAVNGSSSEVEEERRRRLALVRKDLSQFAVCSDEVRKDLAESRAKALIARNEADAMKAKEQLRITAARMKAGVPERTIEKQRIELNAKLIPLVKKQQVHEMGFVEAGSVSGSLGSMPSLSPDDSISVSDRIRMEEANSELRRRMEKLELEIGELKIENRALRNSGGVASSVQRLGKFGTISFKEECEALESILDSKRDPMEDASHACDEDCIEECWKYDRNLNLRPEYREY